MANFATMTKERTQTGTWGGRREGAGRRKGDSRLYAFRASGAAAQFIDSHPNKSAFLTACVEAARQNAVRSVGCQPASAAVPLPPGAVAASRVLPLTLPFFDQRVVAGFPIPLDNDEAAEDINLLRLLCPNPEASYLIRVRGDSMTGAGIHSGDILIVDRSRREPTEREPALCELNGEYTVKYVARHGPRGCLVPANERYPEIEIHEGDDFSVWGVVTYVIHQPAALNEK